MLQPKEQHLRLLLRLLIVCSEITDHRTGKIQGISNGQLYMSDGGGHVSDRIIGTGKCLTSQPATDTSVQSKYKAA